MQMYWPRSPLALLRPSFGQVFTNIEKHAEGAAGLKANAASSWSNCSAPPCVVAAYHLSLVTLATL